MGFTSPAGRLSGTAAWTRSGRSAANTAADSAQLSAGWWKVAAKTAVRPRPPMARRILAPIFACSRLYGCGEPSRGRPFRGRRRMKQRHLVPHLDLGGSQRLYAGSVPPRKFRAGTGGPGVECASGRRRNWAKSPAPVRPPTLPRYSAPALWPAPAGCRFSASSVTSQMQPGRASTSPKGPTAHPGHLNRCHAAAYAGPRRLGSTPPTGQLPKESVRGAATASWPGWSRLLAASSLTTPSGRTAWRAAGDRWLWYRGKSAAVRPVTRGQGRGQPGKRLPGRWPPGRRGWPAVIKVARPMRQGEGVCRS